MRKISFACCDWKHNSSVSHFVAKCNYSCNVTNIILC
jgi:hypothetical protein